MMVLLFEGHPGPHLGEGPGVDGHGRAPLGHPDQARLDQVEPFEELADLRAVARSEHHERAIHAALRAAMIIRS